MNVSESRYFERFCSILLHLEQQHAASPSAELVLKRLLAGREYGTYPNKDRAGRCGRLAEDDEQCPPR